MSIYIVKNARGEEICRYIDMQKAETVAAQLRAAILQNYFVEEVAMANDLAQAA